MAVTITKDTIIGDILDIAPETAPLFMAIGMHCRYHDRSVNEIAKHTGGRPRFVGRPFFIPLEQIK